MSNITRLSIDVVIRIAENFIADHLGNLALAGVPRRMVFPMRAVWAVPIALAYPGYGLAGTIGMVAIDDEIEGVVAATPIDEMRAAAEQLFRQLITDFERRYSCTLDELNSRLNRQEIAEHPTWEDAIEWGKASDQLSKIRVDS
jgi:hypothetical protein